MRKKMFQWQSSTDSTLLSQVWDLQQLAIKNTKRTRLYWSLPNIQWTLSTNTHTQGVSHRKTEGTRTHWCTDTHSCPQNLTSRFRHKQALRWRPWLPIKALSQHRCLPCVCRTSAMWWIRLIRWCLKTLVIPNGAQLIRAARMTFN